MTNTAAPLLKPCPFCGSDDVDADFALLRDALGVTTSNPGCMTCGASTDTNEAWNKRATPAPTVAPVESQPMGKEMREAARVAKEGV